MNPLDQEVARRLTRFYVLALTLIAGLTVSGLLLVNHTISNHYDDSRVLNVAGRQRMLSQRLTKLALLRISGMPAADTVPFRALLRTWSANHTQLRAGTLRMEKTYDVRKSPPLDSMITRIEPVFQSIYQSFSRLNQPGSSPAQQRTAVRVVLRGEPAYLRQMDAIVFRFDAESFARVRDLARMEWLLGAATLLTLLIEGLFVFRPVVRHTRRVVWRLTESETALRKANGQLATSNGSLAVTNAELVRTQAELLRAHDEKHQLQRTEDLVRSGALLEGQEEERGRFARELHDGIGQMLTGLKLHAGTLRKNSLPDEKQRRRVEDVCNLVQDIIQTTRQISHNLMPSVLGDFGLGSALQLLVDQTAHSSAIAVLFEETGTSKRLPPATEIGLYRIAQEALNNAVKHAQAHSIHVRLQYTTENLTLTVADDGRGFTSSRRNTASQPVSNGLENMRTRARLLNGTLALTSKPGKGTRVSVKLSVVYPQPA